MRFIATSPQRQMMVSLWVAGALLASASTASAQGLGIGARLSWVTSDTEADVDAVRFTGGQLRLLGQRLGLEVAIDRRSESFDVRNEKVTETPIQASLLLRLASGSVSPYLLGGPGWYRRKVEPLDGADNLSLNSTEFGWHAGGGLEFIAGRHFGIHGDYRYTFLDFSDDEEEDEGFVGRLLPGHKGSMWTVGATFYF